MVRYELYIDDKRAELIQGVTGILHYFQADSIWARKEDSQLKQPLCGLIEFCIEFYLIKNEKASRIGPARVKRQAVGRRLGATTRKDLNFLSPTASTKVSKW